MGHSITPANGTRRSPRSSPLSNCNGRKLSVKGGGANGSWGGCTWAAMERAPRIERTESAATATKVRFMEPPMKTAVAA